MKYFAKYLPVKGEVQDGDSFIDKRAPDLRIAPGVAMKCIIGIEGEAVNHAQKVGLFLCSRDIQIGDKVKWFDNTNDPEDIVLDESKYAWWTDHGVDNKDRFFKVIGEISPGAVWIKEGDEFEEDAIRILESTLLWSQEKIDSCSSTTYNVTRSNYRRFISSLEGRFEDYKETFIKIKCPVCGNLH